MNAHTQHLLSFLRQVLERSQPQKAICDDCGAVLSGWEAGETEIHGESISNHECQVDEQSREIVRRTWITMTGDPMRARAKGYAVR